MQIPRFNTVTYGNQSITYIAPLLWNILSGEMKMSRILSALKQNVKFGYSFECKC